MSCRSAEGKSSWLPSARGVDLIVGGWQLNTIASWQSGVNRSVTSTNLTGLSYVTQRADATGIDPFSTFNNITPSEDFSSGQCRSILVQSDRLFRHTAAEVRHFRTRHHHGSDMVEH